jgi:membrane fusion protein, copper/silver efflux system
MRKHGLAFLVLLWIFFSFSFGCTEKQSQQNPTQQLSAAAGATQSEPKKEVWTCPMHPHFKSDRPGKCPICGMELIPAPEAPPPVTSESSTYPEGHTSFGLSFERQQMIGVKYGTVVKKPLFKLIQVPGRLAFDPELYTAQSEYIEALKQAERVKDSPIGDVKHSAERMVRSSKLRLRILGLSESQINQVKPSDQENLNLLINKPGQAVWVYAEIYEIDLPYVRPGLSATISAGFMEGKFLTGKVVAVDRVINPVTRTAKARILLPETKSVLRPESYVDVTLQSPLGDQIVVPFDSVLDTGNQSWVFVTDGKGKYEPRLVTVKMRANEEVGIASGLQPGEKIVTSANFLIDSESRLNAVRAAEPQGKTTPSQDHSNHSGH